MKCKECGADNPANSEFCQQCGTRLAKERGDTTKKPGYWKRQTLTGKILIIFFLIIILGIIAVFALAMTVPQAQTTDLNLTDAKSLGTQYDTLQINGTATPGAKVTINNAEITADNNGKFTYNLTNIATGTTNVNITAKAPDKQYATLMMVVIRSVTDVSGGTFYELKWNWNGTVSYYS